MASVIAEFAAKQNVHNERSEAAIDGITGDIKALNDLIEKLQNTPGVITAEDQALLDQIEAKSDAIATKLSALDALVPPLPPAA